MYPTDRKGFFCHLIYFLYPKQIKREGEILKVVEESKSHEQELENELANMWVLVAQLKKNASVAGKVSEFEARSKQNGFHYSDRDSNGSYEEARAAYESERRRCQDLEAIISRLKVCMLPLDSEFNLRSQQIYFTCVRRGKHNVSMQYKRHSLLYMTAIHFIKRCADCTPQFQFLCEER